jgi:hypothetical protein
VGKARLFGDLNDPNSEVSVALKNAKAVQRLDYEKNSVDTDPNIYFINGEIDDLSLQPRDPRYTLAQESWKTLLVPAVLAGIGLSFVGQATFFTKQLVEGEKEFEE